MSQLECLPTELLEAIFLQCLNLNLPRASPSLGVTLSSQNVKTKLLLKAFSSSASFDLEEDEIYLEHEDELRQIVYIPEPGDADYPDASDDDDGFRRQAAEDAIFDLQSDILRCRWVTWDFLKTYMAKSVKEAILRTFTNRELPWCDEKAYKQEAVDEWAHEVVYGEGCMGLECQSPPVHQKTLRNIIKGRDDNAETHEDDDCVVQKVQHSMGGESHFEEIEHINGTCRTELLSLAYECPDSEPDPDRGYHKFDTCALSTRKWSSAEPFFRIGIMVNPHIGLAIFQRQTKDQKGRMYDRCRRWLSLSAPRPGCEVPQKLLHGPWAREKIQLLRALLEAGAFVASHDRRLAKKALWDAIDEKNYEAVDLLAHDFIDTSSDHTHEGIRVQPRFMWTEFRNLGTGSDQETRLGYVEQRLTAGIYPNTSHLRLAVMDRGCPKAIVSRLLCSSTSSHIDAHDSKLRAWIKERKDEGDEKGGWLEKQLDETASRITSSASFRPELASEDDSDDNATNT